VLTNLKISCLIEGPLLTENIGSDDCDILKIAAQNDIRIRQAMIGLAQPGSKGTRKFQQPARDFTRIVRGGFALRSYNGEVLASTLMRQCSTPPVLYHVIVISIQELLNTLYHRDLFFRHLNKPLKISETRYFYLFQVVMSSRNFLFVAGIYVGKLYCLSNLQIPETSPLSQTTTPNTSVR
jgi:hypothetical protein